MHSIEKHEKEHQCYRFTEALRIADAMAAHVRKIFIVAGEPSGDIIGSRLIRSLRQLAPDTSFEFFGVGGSHMIKDGGFHSIFPMEEISVMGLFEVLPRLPNIYNRLEATVSVLREVKPDCIVTIDSKVRHILLNFSFWI